MDGGYSRIKDEAHPQLLDLIPNERNWLVKREDDHNLEESNEKKLELRLGPPGVEDWSVSLDAQKNHKLPQKAAQKRSAPAPVVGWPPIRSFRKNIASSSSSKQAPVSDSQNVVVSNNVVQKEKTVEKCQKGFFVKINMNGVPIGRKVDLNAYDTYEKLSVAVDQLFRGLLAAQNDTSGARVNGNREHERPITGLLDGKGEYTLVYEDNEGDRMLVGDVPWHMFVSSVKRLRVIKSSEISNISRLGSKQEKSKV
ncbi:putative transcription factor interactor and regulator AUX-IAA family [Helianthus annuus]|nr:putative transcription factor interactor and regulator AUX-IAA family [Helianthus annuus]